MLSSYGGNPVKSYTGFNTDMPAEGNPSPHISEQVHAPERQFYSLYSIPWLPSLADLNVSIRVGKGVKYLSYSWDCNSDKS